MAGMVKRIGRDRFRLRLSTEEITLLRSLPDQLRSVLTGPDAAAQDATLFGGPEGGPGDTPTRPEPTDPGPGDVRGGFGDTPDDFGNVPGDAGDRVAGPGNGADEPQRPGTDPVLERLFPPAYPEAEDVDRDAEYHRLVHDDLLQEKLANLDVVTSTLDRGTPSLRRWTIDLTEDEAGSWLGALNDLRLALGVRLGITEDFDGDIDPSDPQAPALRVLSYLGWVEENLVEALSSG
jgi:hypothetical protein